MGWLKERREARLLAEMLQRIDGKHIAYATMRMPDGTEKVLGKNGSVNLNEGEIFLRVGDVYVFHGNLAEVTVGELMSLNGVTIKGQDLDSGEYRSVVGYYEYHRK